MEKYKHDFIKFMLECKVMSFGDFVLKSGRHSPYFINTGKYRTGGQISVLGDYYAKAIVSNCSLNDKTLLFGPAYKGIPLAAAAASSLYRNYGIDVRYCFNRKEAKDHGEGGIFVGAVPEPGDKIIIVEDVITAGTALRENLPLFEAIGGIEITAMIISADRMELMPQGKTAADSVLDEFGFPVHSIVNVLEIREYMIQNEDGALVELMDKYMEQYCKKI